MCDCVSVSVSVRARVCVCTFNYSFICADYMYEEVVYSYTRSL